MRRLVQAGLLLCGASLFLLLVSGSPARAADGVAPTAKITRTVRAKIKPAAHAEHARLAAKKLAAEHRKPVRKRLASRAKPIVKKPASHSRPTAVAGNHPAAQTRAPILLINARPARPAPAEAVDAAVADRLAASLNRPAPAPSADRAASDFVTVFLTEAFRIARSMDSAPDQRRAELANLMTARMDLSRILQYATHAAFQAASPAMQQQFRLSFASFLAEAYTPRIKLAAELAFSASAPHPNEGGVEVSTTFTKPGYPESTIDWQLEPAGNSYRIVDVSSQGVSLLEIQRSSFTSVMLNDGGLQGLLNRMDARTRELASSAK